MIKLTLENKNKIHAFLNQRPKVTKQVALKFLLGANWDVVSALNAFDAK